MRATLRCTATARSGAATAGEPTATKGHGRNAAAPLPTRRSIAAFIAMTLPAMAAQAADTDYIAANQEDLPPWAKKALEKSIALKEERYKERLQDYYKRNFKEYFEFDAADAKAARARGISDETRGKIVEWLEKNK